MGECVRIPCFSVSVFFIFQRSACAWHTLRADVVCAVRTNPVVSGIVGLLMTKLPPTKVGGLAHSVLLTNVINLAPSSARMSQNMNIKVTV